MSHSSSSFTKFLENVLEPRTAGVGDAEHHAEKACSDAGSSSWLRPCSKQRDESHFLKEHAADGPENPLLIDEPISVVPIRIDKLDDEAPTLVDVKAEMEEFDNAVEQRRLDRSSGSRRRAPRRSRKKPCPKKFKIPDPPGSTISTEKSLGVMRRKCSISDEIDLRLPSPSDRADQPPEGYFTLYESFFDVAYLWFPIPLVILEFLAKFYVSISQITPRGIRHLVGYLVRSYECEEELTVHHLRNYLDLRRSPPKDKMLYYISPRKDFRIFNGFVSKDRQWADLFFYVPICSETLGEGVDLIRTRWTRKVSNLILKTPDNTQAVHTLLASQGCNWDKHFSLRRVEKARAFFGGSSVSSFFFPDSPEVGQSEMGKRSFRDLAAGSAGTSKASAPPRDSSAPRATSTPSAAHDLVPSASVVPNPTSSNSAPLPKKSARVSSSLVLAMPASDPKAARPSDPLAVSRSGDDVRRKAKGKSQDVAGADHRGNESQSADGREPKRPRTDPSSPIKVSQSVFDDDSTAARLFATLAFPDDPCGPVQGSSSSSTMSRAGLRFLAFVNRVCYELEDEAERHKLRADVCAKGESVAKAERNKYADRLERRNKELQKALSDNEGLRAENEELSRKLEVAEKSASNSLNCLSDRNAQVTALKAKVGKKRTELKTAKVLIVDLYEQFAAARAKLEELKGVPQDRMVFQIQRKANLDFVKQLMGLIPEREVPKLEDELASLTADVEAHAGDEEYFDKLMESLGECLDVVLPEFAKPSTRNQDVPLEKLAADAGIADVSGSHMLSESAGGLLQEMRIDSAGLLKDLMISEDGRMSFAGEDEVEETTVAVEHNLAEGTETAGAEKIATGDDGNDKADSEKAGEDEEGHS
ncbi:hypothetical protein AALP_AAs62710U000200 [Arabis alpina]|uniref:Transposase (Putative), gypsy type n=1 Tax=Arabis alpina TaxID=50452 RepID=A0A087G2E9_ARAAL|nr:hypothetical protein AALP_AAs62710U000200 [Arabis alpina]